MRLIIFVTLISFSLCNEIFAQDIIVKTNGEELEVKVEEITLETIRYRSFDNLNGPLRNISINEVFMVIYENGRRETFTSQHTTTSNTSDSNIKTNYAGIGFGYGNSFGGLGANFQYVGGDNFRFGFHIGGGYLPSGDIFLISGGFKFYLVESLYLNPQFGSFGGVSYWDSRFGGSGGTLYGPSLLIGYELYLSNTFGIIGSVGGSYDIGDWNTGAHFALDSGFIIRF